MKYLLDSNVFIEAKRLHYGFDFCPAFWDWLDEKATSATVRSVSRVATELYEGEDDLAEWAKERGERLFLEPTPESMAAFAKVSRWATDAGYQPVAVNTFLDVADSYLVATALADGYTVVTREKPADSKRMIKIPNACVAMDVKYLNPFDMLRLEKARFVLGKVA